MKPGRPSAPTHLKGLGRLLRASIPPPFAPLFIALLADNLRRIELDAEPAGGRGHLTYILPEDQHAGGLGGAGHRPQGRRGGGACADRSRSALRRRTAPGVQTTVVLDSIIAVQGQPILVPAAAGLYVGYIYETFTKIQQSLKVLNVANGAKDTINNKQDGMLAPNLHFGKSSVG